MADFKTKKTRKTVSLIATMALCLSALGTMGWGIYNITQNITRSSDFSEGQSIQLNLRIYQTDANGDPVLEDGNLKPLYSAEEQTKHLATAATSLINNLQAKNLTNIKVSTGFANIPNSKFITTNNFERVATLYASFENSATAFKLNDIKEAKYEYSNNQKIFESLNQSIKYEFELVKPEYIGKNYQITSAKRNTGRAALTDPTNGIYYDKEASFASGSNLKLYTGQDTNGEFKISENDKMADKVTIQTKNELNTWAFVKEKAIYDNLVDKDEAAQSINNYLYRNENWFVDAPSTYADDEPSEPTTEPTDQQKHQTNYSWLLWKDKQGLLNYLNSLVTIWYYNLYANKIENIQGELSHSNLDKVFDVSKYGYASFVDTATRDKINEIIKNLSTTEKSFISMLGQMKGTTPSDPNTWRPSIIEEQDLIPVLYNFYNSKTWNSSYTEITKESIPAYGFSTSVQNGWGWLESDNNTALSELISDYLVTKIDHKSFGTNFVNSDSKAAATDPYATSDVYLDKIGDGDINAFIKLLNTNIAFPIVQPYQTDYVQNFANIVDPEMKLLETEAAGIPFNEPDNQLTKDFVAKRIVFAKKYFGSNNIFTQQSRTKAWYDNSFTTMNPFDILLIAMGAILFIVGIFISVRYRIPGIVAFIMAAFVFVMSLVLYNSFGFGSSLYSFIALVFGSFLSLLSPIFLCRNTAKEIKETSTISASVVKSVKKYWKTSLDFHVISIVCSLSFLFFGIGGNINFGAMLIISVFLSFLLSGIIFFVLMLFFTQYAQANTFEWFFNKGYYGKLVNFNQTVDSSKWHNNFLYKAWNYYTVNLRLTGKATYIGIGASILIAIVGIFVFGFVGALNSLDFNNTNILIIRNVSQLNITIPDVLRLLNINAIQSYVYNNEIFIYTTQTFDLSSIQTALSQFGTTDLISNSVSFNTMTTEVSMQVLTNTMACIGIAIGFSAVWSMLSLNIVAILPLAIVQFLPIFILSGLFGVLQIPLQLEITLMMSVVFMLNSVIGTSSLSVLKSSWDRTQPLGKNELKALFASILSKTNVNYIIFIGLFAIMTILAMIFASPTLIVAFACLLIMLAWISFYTNRLLIHMWYYCVLIRNIFSKELLLNKNQKTMKKNYDRIDEQVISGINN